MYGRCKTCFMVAPRSASVYCDFAYPKAIKTGIMSAKPRGSNQGSIRFFKKFQLISMSPRAKKSELRVGFKSTKVHKEMPVIMREERAIPLCGQSFLNEEIEKRKTAMGPEL